MKDMIFKGQVNETDAAKLHTGMQASIQIAALPKTDVTGTLTKLGLQSAQASTANNLNASSSNSNGNIGSNPTSPFNVGFKIEISQLRLPKNVKLLAGYSATASIVVQQLNKVLTIPERVLQFDGDKIFVWIPDKNKKLEKRYIQIGLSNEINAQVLSGVKLNEKVLESGPNANLDKDSSDQSTS